MKVRLAVIFTVSMLISAGPACAAALNDARFEFHQGNTNYSSGEYEQAIAHYEQVLSLGFESAPLYYNLGNAYFKSGFLGKAVLNYIRAGRLSPKDADLISNLNYARSTIKGGIVSAGRNYFSRAFFILADSFSLDGITVVSVSLYIILSALIILVIVLSDTRRLLVYISVPVSLLLALSVSIFITQLNKTVIRKEAVVTAESADSKFEPLEEATTFFSLSEGESVFVVEVNGGWAKIKRLDGKQGWVKAADLESV